MAASIIRLEAFKRLVRVMKDAAPELGDHVYIKQAPVGQKACFPSLVIDPVRFAFEPLYEDEHFEPDERHLVLNVGCHRATVQLRLAAASLNERYQLEEKLLNAFLSREGAPGVLITPVTSCPEVGNFVAAWELEEDTWNDEKAFDSQSWAYLTVTGLIPALVTRGGVPTIEHLRVGVTFDFDTPATASAFGSVPKARVVEINQDGTFTAV